MKEAKARRDFVAGAIAAGGKPADALEALLTPQRERTIEEWGEAMTASRLDVSEGRITFLKMALRTRINPTFGDRTPRSVRASDVQEWVAALVVDKLAARSVQKYWQVLAQVLDYTETSPNPARHKTVKLP